MRRKIPLSKAQKQELVAKYGKEPQHAQKAAERRKAADAAMPDDTFIAHKGKKIFSIDNLGAIQVYNLSFATTRPTAAELEQLFGSDQGYQFSTIKEYRREYLRA